MSNLSQLGTSYTYIIFLNVLIISRSNKNTFLLQHLVLDDQEVFSSNWSTMDNVDFACVNLITPSLSYNVNSKFSFLAVKCLGAHVNMYLLLFLFFRILDQRWKCNFLKPKPHLLRFWNWLYIQFWILRNKSALNHFLINLNSIWLNNRHVNYY